MHPPLPRPDILQGYQRLENLIAAIGLPKDKL